MLGLVKITQNTMKKAYSFVPMQDFNEVWTDEKLYKKYGLTKEEITFIESMLECINLKKTFHLDNNPDNDKKALQGVSLTIHDNDFISVIGGNGSGKTTLLNLIAGVHSIDEGHLILDGVDITAVPEYQRAKWIGRVFQDPMQGTIASISLFENLVLASNRGKKVSPFKWALTKEKKAEFAELLRPLNLGLEDRLDAKIGTFSGGQRQSVTLLMATMSTPKLLLLDEHTAALDPKTAKTVMAAALTSKCLPINP